LQDGTIIKSTFVIWAAGIIGDMPKGINPSYITKSNRIQTDDFNKVLMTNNIFAVGDIASVMNEQNPNGYPQLASVAIDQAKNVALNFLRIAHNKIAKPFFYNNKGNMATIGRNRAVVDLAKPKLSFQGFFAWVIWMTLHLFLLIGFKNKLIVFINWMYKYFTRHQSLSLIFKPLVRPKDEIINS
jgi:NADH:ubiquinone reductase (H+-translocating)